MIIEQIFIDSFGTLQQRTFTFTPGLNVIEGENEAGKSTLCLSNLCCTDFPHAPMKSNTASHLSQAEPPVI